MSKTVAKQESGLQAVIIADNFNVCAVPLGTSWALLPLAGARVIDYTIEFLLQTPVEEVIIFSVHQAQQVEKYVKDRWITNGLVPFRVIFMSSESCHSLGDALRDIDSKALIKSDFLLTQAGFVSNYDLGSALAAHRARRVKDKNAVLTLLYSQSSINHPARVRESDAFLVLDTVTNRLLHCQHLVNNSQEFEFPVEVLTLNDEVTTRFDLLDCNLAICSAQIPPLFADNFDFQTRRHLIREILTNEEILAYRVFVHVVEEKLALFVGDFNSYLAVNQSILERWSYPIVPDGLNGNESTITPYSWRWPNVYVANGVKRIAKSARVERDVLIGANCDIAEKCELVNVIMGKNCIIGPNSKLKNCVLWDNVVLESDCIVENSILCDKSRVGQNTRISGRCILGKEVNLPSGMKIEPGSVLCKTSAPEDSDIASEPEKPANAFRWRIVKTAAGNESEFWPQYSRLVFAEGRKTDRASSSDGGDSGSADEMNETVRSGTGAKGVDDVAVDDDYEIFYQEVLESLNRGYSKQIACDNLIMEINSSKHAYNVPVAELQRRVMTAILAAALEQNKIKTDTTPDLVKAYTSVLSQFLPLINNYFKPKNHSASASTSATTQSHCLAAIKDFALADERFVPALSQVLYFLYDKDIFEEDVLLPWCNQLEAPLKSQLHAFIQWLEEAEEESSDDD